MARILLIDDDEQLRRTTRRLLQHCGYEVLAASDGADGLRLWRERGADLVITDVCMPTRTGIEVLVELRMLAPHLTVIAMSGGSGSGGLDLLGTARLAGALHILPKPFTAAELLGVVRDALPPDPGSPHS